MFLIRDTFYVIDLDAYSAHLLSQGHAPSTRRAYSTAVTKYREMCVRYALPPYPVDHQAAKRFITYLSMLRVNPRTIQVYLSGIRAWHVSAGMEPPHILTPVNQLLLRSVSRSAPPPRRAEPFKVTQLKAIMSILPVSLDNIAYMSAMLLIFYGCMRASELCVHPTSNPHPALLAQFKLFTNPLRLEYTAKSSKTAHRGFKVVIGCTHGSVCPVCLFLFYIHCRAPLTLTSPVYVLSNGRFLSYSLLNYFIKKVTSSIGLNSECYSSHSLRAGAATAAAQAGCNDDQIKRMGRWASDAYSNYIRPAPATEAALAALLNART